MKQPLSLTIEGMHCDGCVHRVTAALGKVEGAIVEDVKVGAAKVHFDSELAGKEVLIDAVNRLGFKARES